MRRVAVFCGLAFPIILVGCSGDDGSSSDTDATETGDGDGDPTTGDGDGDGDPTTGDGDGDGDPTTGDGDGDPATGDGDGDPTTGDGDGDGDGDPGVFALTSPAYEEGGTIPDANSCFGANVSPELNWVAPPPGTQSYALFFWDLDFNFNHSAIWNISMDLDGVPAAVEKQAMPASVPGASQPKSYAGNFGYAGPCPPALHNYEWILYALDVDTLDGELDTNASLGAVKTALEAHKIESTTLVGMFESSSVTERTGAHLPMQNRVKIASSTASPTGPSPVSPVISPSAR